MSAKVRQRKTKASLRDPKCGRIVDPRKAVRLSWEDKTYVFCSERCRRQFEDDPPGDAGF